MSISSAGVESVPGAAAADSSESDDPVVKCVALSKTFRDFWLRNRVRAVEGVDLEVYPGEVFGLLGPNGSGKSTAVKMILGLLHPTAGRIFVYGRRPDDVGVKDRIGYLPEESYLYPFLNARETLDYYGQLFGFSRPDRRRRIDMLLEMVGLSAVQRRPIAEYSKGMQRRIGLAQALINDPQLLVLDEPTTGMDPVGTRQIKDVIAELAERGKTVLLCSHLLADVEDVCNRVAIMFGGRIRDAGTVDELLVQQDLTRFETARLDDETIQEIEALLQRRGKHIHRVDRPRQRLESLFLEIVHRAQEEGAETSGAVAGGRMAAFLTGAGDGGEGKEVLEQLVRGEASETGEAPAKQAEETRDRPEPEGETGEASATDRSVIDSLVGDRPRNERDEGS